MATSRDIHDLVSKLSSDKVKAREEGIRLLNSWMDGDRSVGFCRLLTSNTARISPGDLPSADTWPFLVSLLTKCVMTEISSSKKRLPKLIYAKTLRTAIQRAEHSDASGKLHPLFPIAKSLFNHIFDVLRDVHTFQSEYGIILRQLLLVKDYRARMKKQVYCSLVHLYIKKLEATVGEKGSMLSNAKEENFRWVLTFHSLLEKAPGDFSKALRDSLTNGFVSIFSHIKEESKISRKLLECVNVFLLQDGPNLGSKTLKIHFALQDFISCIWHTTRDRSFKNALILYARIQIKLRKDEVEENYVVQQFFDMVIKELDQTITSFLCSSWEDKGGTMASSQRGLMELAASIIYKVFMCQDHETSLNKRPKRESAGDCVKEGLIKGKWLWYGAFCSLIENYGDRINSSLIAIWFTGICENLDRIFNDCYNLHAYDGLLWILRALHGLSSLQSFNSQCMKASSSNFQEVGSCWHTIWSCIIHWLPLLCKAASLADAAFLVLGNIISNDLITSPNVPPDVWDLQAFKDDLSVGSLYFIAQYFSRGGLQGDLGGNFDLRQKLLKVVLRLNSKGLLLLNGMLIFLPAAIFSLVAGCFVLPPILHQSLLCKYMKCPDVKDDKIEVEEHERILEHELFDCSIDLLSRIYPLQVMKEGHSLSNSCSHFPKLSRQKLLIQVEDWALVDVDQKIDHLSLHELLLFSSFLFIFIYSYTRIGEVPGTSIFLSQMFSHLRKYLHQSVSIFDGSHSQIDIPRLSDSLRVLDSISSIVVPSHCSKYSFLFSMQKNVESFREIFPSEIVQNFESILFYLVKLFEKIPHSLDDNQSELFADHDNNHAATSDEARVVDMDLDMDIGASDDSAIVREKGLFVIADINLLKKDLILAMTKFSYLLPDVVIDFLFELLRKEPDPEVLLCIFRCLCKSCINTSSERIAELIDLLVELVNDSDSKNISSKMLTCTHCLLDRFSASDIIAKDYNVAYKKFSHVGDILNKFADGGRLHWDGRVELVDCICCFISLVPQIGQDMIEKLLAMVQDPDYRVRLFLARRIGVLFQTWDGHQGLFQDICLSFGVKIVMVSKENLVTADEVLSAGAQSRLALETALVTLGHVAFMSEIVELEAVFMISTSAAIDPSLRELAYFLLSNLSKRLNYDSREKYLKELLGSLISCWISSGVSLVGLVEVRKLFVGNSEAGSFLQYCCPWLIPSLILNGKTSDLQWVAMLASEPVAAIVRKHFVPVFAVCMALHCSEKSSKNDVAAVLRISILQIADISENERDGLIKKHMVSIVSYLLSLCSSASDPVVPFFTVQTIVLAIRTIVDGFLEIEDLPFGNSVVDKINIFRPDRVFKFLLDIHYQITGAVHPRHRCHKLASIEVLIIVLGERAIIPSTSFYIFNIAAQFIDHKALHRQCCHVFSILIRLFQKSILKERFNTLGEQLQFVVSKLVACYIPSKGSGEVPSAHFSGVVSILRDLIVDADHSLYEYIKDLEPFPELDGFEQFRAVQHKVCKSYHPKDHLLKFVGKSHSLSHKFLLSSLEALHKKLLHGELVQLKKDQKVSWCSEPEIVSAVWMLVGMCACYDWIDIPELLADFISRIGIVDPHHVVFQLPYDSFKLCPTQMISVEADVVSSAVLSELLVLLRKYLMDDSVNVIDLASRAVQGILSTERGQAALQSFACFDKSLLQVHSKGVNLCVVDRLIHEVKASKVVPLEDCSLWDTRGKSYDKWLCPLVHSLISHVDDIILRLCQEIVLVKADLAELLFPVVLANLAQGKEVASDIRQLVSSQVKDCIFSESNELLKSIQLMLNAMNMLRIGHITTKLNATQKQVASKVNRSSGYSSRSRVVSERSKDSSPLITDANPMPSEKVYWLSIDYLATAKAAIHCGSYFTAVMYVEHWCEEHFNAITIGEPDFSPNETLSRHIELLVTAIKHINEPDGIYGIIQSHKLTLQSITFEHEGNWRKAIECYDLLLSTTPSVEQVAHASPMGLRSREGLKLCALDACDANLINHKAKDLGDKHGSYKGLMRCLQQNGCTHILDFYRKGLTAQRDNFQQDSEFVELQYEAAWRVGNWDFSLNTGEVFVRCERQTVYPTHFHGNLHSCLRALQNGDLTEFSAKLSSSKQELVLSICQSSKESTENIYTAIIRLQILDHLGMAWGLRWPESTLENRVDHNYQELLVEPATPNMSQMDLLTEHWDFILKQTQFHLHLLEPFIAFRRVLLQILNCKPYLMQHLLQSARTLRKGSRLSQALAALHELKSLSLGKQDQQTGSYLFSLGRLEEAKLLRDQGQQEMAINLAKYILHYCEMKDETSNVYRLVGKWLTEMGSSNSRTILEQYLKQAVELVNGYQGDDNRSVERKCRTYFHLAHYADALFMSYEERLASSEWQAAMRLRRHKTKELEALIKRLKSLAKSEKTDYSVKIQELQKQLSIDKEEAERLQNDRDHFLDVALAGYRHCLVAGDKYDLRVVFRLVSLWFSLCSRSNVISSMLETVKEVQSYKFLPLVYQIASRMGSGSKDTTGSHNFQCALVSLVKKMAIEHPYHTIFQLLALANGDRVKDKQRSRNSFVVDMEKKYAAENLLKELSTHHGNRIVQMKQMVETYIKLAELDTKKEDTNKKITLPREIRCLRQLELVPVVTATLPVDHSCQYVEGSFPHFTCLADTVVIMNGINAPKVVECFGSNGKKYRQLAKSGNDDLRQDAVMEQFFGLVNTFLLNNRDTWKRRLRIRTYKVVPFTPSAGILEWVDGTIPLGDYLIGSHRNGGAHGRYGIGDWTYAQCREYMTNEKDKRKSFEKVCDNFRPVLHHFFLERYLQAPQWFENRLSYTKSVAASSMVGYIVGLGDRHSMNILIDEVTAEVVHIDLGVAFEQGLMLKTPERVPFRLTRDIIDGMGVTGVEGVFRRCCEETLSVMRTNKEALLTIIEVFIHDPLYKWALSPLKALQRQKETEDDIDSSLEDSQDVYEGNKDAARALLRVKQKLDGYDEGEMRSVQGQVQQLIQNAVDVDRLCQMFPGWGAWL